MGEKRKKRGIENRQFLAAVAICALFIGGGNVNATQSSSVHSPITQEQMQSRTIQVKVVDSKGEPIIGANVLEKGTTNGIITNIDGIGKLTVKTGAVLQVSYIGYASQEVKATSSTIKVVLKEDTELLSEVVVVGYGSQKKENLTGAVASVNVSETLEGRPIADIGRGLQGTTPGLSITLPSGEIGADPTIKIRGQIGSESGNTAPLILLDNVEIPSISLVNPDDIESISILKDAASASIYGSKAAFGVVLITSKKGAKQERVNISYQNNFSWQHVSKDMEMAGIDALDYIGSYLKRVNKPYTGAFWMVGQDSYEQALAWQEKWGGKVGSHDPFVYGRDWYVSDNKKFSMRTFNPYDYMIKDWAPSQSHNISLNGKSGKTSFNIGLGYLDQSGMNKAAKRDDFRRWNGSVKLSTEFNKYLTVRAGAIYSKRQKRFANVSTSTTADAWYYMYRWSAVTPWGQDEEGNPLRSPASEAAQANTATYTNNYTNFNVGATINLTKDWKIDIDYSHANHEYIQDKPGMRYTATDTWGSASLRKDANGNQVYVDGTGAVVGKDAPGAMPAYSLANFEYTSQGASGNDYMYRRSQNSRQTTLNINTNYDWKINDDNNLKFLLGMNRVAYDEEYNWSKITQLTDLANPQFDLTGGTQTSGGGKNWDGQLGFFGRINYNLKDRYLLEANVRYDATSKFPSDLRWRWFPSFSAGWRLSEETFMEWAKPALSSLKLRASWGMIGDQTVPNSLYVPTMKSEPESWLDASGNKLIYVGTPTAIVSDITWQDIYTLDFGVDARFFDGALGVTFDWYQRDTKNMIVPADGFPLTFGTGAPKGNYGSLRTRGWELSLDYAHRFNNGLGINAMFTLSDAITDITEYGDTKSIDKWYTGKRYGEIWGYRTDRLYQKEDFVWENGKIVTTYALNGKEVAANTPGAKKVNKLSDPKGVYQDFMQSGEFIFGPGDVKYVDVNGDGKFDNGSGTYDDPGDKEVIGNSTPRFEYGFRLGADYKGFDLSVFCQGVGKREIWGDGPLAIPGYSLGDGAMPQTFAGDFWKEDRTDAFYPRPYEMSKGNDAFNMHKQSRYLLDMSYFRIKNITLGYTLPQHLTKHVWMQKARVYLALENFFTFDKLNGLPVDPEEVSGYSMFNADNYNSGRTGVGVPTFKSVSVGVQLNF